MKLRCITLADVRQFTSPVQVSGISDGLNVLSAANESGKSTLFDAIQAVFFIPHRSAKIAPLRPSVGGNPDITLQIDLDGTLHDLHKRWGRGALAEVHRAGRLIAKGDEAEAFIAALTQPADEGGPAGLLWVRQGLTALDEGSAKEQKSAQTARRDLMSSVTGEFEALTGGKRMDRALARARAEFDTLMTQRGPKANGPLDTAVKHLESLTARHAELSSKAAHLRVLLDQRRGKRRDLADLCDPAEAKDRAERLAQAKAANDAADRYAEGLRAAQDQLRSAEMAQIAAVQQSEARQRAEVASGMLAQKLAEAEDLAAQNKLASDKAVETLKVATGLAQAAQRTRRDCESRLQAALRAAARQSQIARHTELVQALGAAQTLATALPRLQDAAAKGPDAKALQAIDDAHRALQLAEGLASAAAPHITLHYDSPQTPRATLNGKPLNETTALPEVATLVLPGYGRLILDPGRSGEDPAKLARARDQLAILLDRSGLTSAEEARAAARARSEAQAQLRDTMADLSRLAPEGIDALRAEITRLAPSTVDAAAEDPDAAQSAANAAARAQDEADAAVEDARTRRDATTLALVRATTERDALRHRLTEAQTARDALPDAEILRAEVTRAAAAHRAAQDRHAGLAADAPDLATCRATLDRAQDVMRRAEADVVQLRIDLTKLDTLIEADAGNGIDEDLADTMLQMTAAQATVDALRHEVEVLKTLIKALETAQSSARDRYFAPVLAELRPMLRFLWPDAELRFDGDSLLPSALVRDGQPEDIGTLSGGTREQIALLVRLAFARLLAKAGQHAPVILDDALVYTDDDRIEQMFTALHAQSQDLQVLVFSCRTRAMRALGGRNLSIESVSATP